MRTIGSAVAHYKCFLATAMILITALCPTPSTHPAAAPSPRLPRGCPCAQLTRVRCTIGLVEGMGTLGILLFSTGVGR